nr:PREDICTED: zinc finger MYM-type protein 2 [Lepisosteus oculatus]
MRSGLGGGPWAQAPGWRAHTATPAASRAPAPLLQSAPSARVEGACPHPHALGIDPPPAGLGPRMRAGGPGEEAALPVASHARPNVPTSRRAFLRLLASLPACLPANPVAVAVAAGARPLPMTLVALGALPARERCLDWLSKTAPRCPQLRVRVEGHGFQAACACGHACAPHLACGGGPGAAGLQEGGPLSLLRGGGWPCASEGGVTAAGQPQYREAPQVALLGASRLSCKHERHKTRDDVSLGFQAAEGDLSLWPGRDGPVSCQLLEGAALGFRLGRFQETPPSPPAGCLSVTVHPALSMRFSVLGVDLSCAEPVEPAFWKRHPDSAGLLVPYSKAPDVPVQGCAHPVAVVARAMDGGFAERLEPSVAVEGAAMETEEGPAPAPDTPGLGATEGQNPGQGPHELASPPRPEAAPIQIAGSSFCDSWISQSASFPRNQKQPGVDSPSPAASLPKSVFPPPAVQQSSKPVKVTCANCKKPLRKGQTAYQRKGSAHLFCSTTCLSAFSHKPAPKKNCTMCKKDITSMKGTIVAQVDSSESFQEFCSTGCLSSYENKQNPPKSTVKTRCTVCGKLTEIRHEVSFKNVTHKICSDHCFNRYRMANGLIMNCCEQCGDYLPNKASANHFLIIDGQQKRFCCQNCVKEYKQTHGKITCCTGCRTPCRFFDITHCIGSSGNMEPYCSTACMNSHKSKNPRPAGTGATPSCHFCKRSALPQFQATMPDGKLYNFCSSNCVAKFQTLSVQTTTNGQPAPSSNNIQLKCNYCRGSFSLKPETLEWENKVYQFCSKTCCDDYKKLHCIVTYCEYCQEEKTLHETVKFSGVKRPFCSEGCKLLFKQEFARRLGLKCVTCNYCSQMCKRGATKEIDGVVRDFCSEACSKKFTDWYYKAARCDCCKVQGNLTESVQWRAEMKHFCDQQCLLRFYCQQNEPNMSTQKGPENLPFGQGTQTQASKTAVSNQVSSVSSYSSSVVREMKNKAVLCKPLTMTKATYCKPHMQTKSCQTEEVVKTEYVPVPVPVPVYIPVPMNMYSQATPTPVTLPVPIPVPIFLPTTLDSAEKIVQTIDELKAKIPPDPREADILTMAEMIAEEDEKPGCTAVKSENEMSEGGSSDEKEEPDDSYEPDLDLENDFPRAPDPVVEELDSAFMLPLVLGEESEEKPQPQVKKKGHKRRLVSDNSHVVRPDTPDNSFALKSTYGVNAWKRWASTAAESTEDEKAKELKQTRPVRLKRNLLSHAASELNYGLSRFVSEVRRPNGDSYAPDSVFYLCLGIQKHLQENGRTDSIFTDPYYQLFGQELNKLLKDWQPSVLPDGSLFCRIEEQYLWSSKQFGDHSPMVLLCTLVYFNTKYFGLRTVEQHLRLSFVNVYRQWKKSPHSKESAVRVHIPSIFEDDLGNPEQKTDRKRREEAGDPDCDPGEGSGRGSRCPVRAHERQLYELYLSKCPGSLKQRTDTFYMKPESSSCPESPLWYSTTPLERSTLENILARILLIKEIYNEEDASEPEDDSD